MLFAKKIVFLQHQSLLTGSAGGMGGARDTKRRYGGGMSQKCVAVATSLAENGCNAWTDGDEWLTLQQQQNNNSEKNVDIDMALTATLKFGSNTTQAYDKEYKVTDFHIVSRRDYNKFCPEGNATCERLEVNIIGQVVKGEEVKDLKDLEMYEWYDLQTTKDGRLEICTSSVKASDSDTQHVICFENARCFSLSEHYDIGVARRRILLLGIEAESIHVDNVDLKRP